MFNYNILVCTVLIDIDVQHCRHQVDTPHVLYFSTGSSHTTCIHIDTYYDTQSIHAPTILLQTDNIPTDGRFIHAYINPV